MGFKLSNKTARNKWGKNTSPFKVNLFVMFPPWPHTIPTTRVTVFTSLKFHTTSFLFHTFIFSLTYTKQFRLWRKHIHTPSMSALLAVPQMGTRGGQANKHRQQTPLALIPLKVDLQYTIISVSNSSWKMFTIIENSVKESWIPYHHTTLGVQQ